MYVAVQGGEKAIENAHRLVAEDRRGDPSVPEISAAQVAEQLSLGVGRVMAEASLFDRELAALALKQARGDTVEAAYLLRAYRTTLPRFGYSMPLALREARLERRISATFKDLPGGQVLGATFDYSHRLLDLDLLTTGELPDQVVREGDISGGSIPRVLGDILQAENVIEREMPPTDEAVAPVGDITRDPVSYPADRDMRLQTLSRADEGFLLSLAYSTMRGFGDNHGFVGELRAGWATVEFVPEELGFAIEIGEIEITECETVNQFRGTNAALPQFTRGYGITTGRSDRKAIAMALVDRALRSRELGEDILAPAQDEEFVLAHCDSTQAAGFVEHIKLPHYGGFLAELSMLKRLRREAEERLAEFADAAE